MASEPYRAASMAYESFRDWVAALEKAGELIRIPYPVATELEITEIADREMKKPDGGKALLFEKGPGCGLAVPGGHQHAGFVETHGHEHERRLGG